MQTERRPESRFDFDLTTPEPIPEAAISRATELMRSGRLFRYREVGSGDVDDVGLLEREFALATGRRYAVAVNSCGAAMFLALRCAGVQPGDAVLANSFTLAPVPGAIHHAGGVPVLVETTESLTADLDDLREKAARSGARWLLLSHMRGHVSDLDAVRDVCGEAGVTLIEDCAHTLGAGWGGRPTGGFGQAGCFSLQTFKHVNSGEGGVVVTDDEALAARAILYSGSYMHYGQHQARPDERVFEELRATTPNYSMRMSAWAAAVARPQLELLPARIKAMNNLYRTLESLLLRIPQIRVPERATREEFVGSSIQFNIPGFSVAQMESFVNYCSGRGLHINWFGRPRMEGFTSRPDQWGFIDEPQELPRTAVILRTLCDLRLPPAMEERHCRVAADLIEAAIQSILSE